MTTRRRRQLAFVALGMSCCVSACAQRDSTGHLYRRIMQREAACEGKPLLRLPQNEMWDDVGDALVQCQEAIYRKPAAKAYAQCTAYAPCGVDCGETLPQLPPLRAHHELRLACERFALRCGANPATCWGLMTRMSPLQEHVAMAGAACFNQPCAPGDRNCDACSPTRCSDAMAAKSDAEFNRCMRDAL